MNQNYQKKAMILAAGLGTRLKPLTSNKPKALVEIAGKTLLQITIERLKHYGFNDICINIHHFAAQIKSYMAQNRNFGISIQFSDESDMLLDTGGGVKKALPILGNGPVLVHNVDIISEVDLLSLFHDHLSENERVATLCVSSRPSSRYLLFDDKDQLCGWEKPGNNEKRIVGENKPASAYAFSGIQVIDTSSYCETKLSGAFSLIDFYLEQAKDKIIRPFVTDKLIIDAGKPENIQEIEQWMK